MTTLETMYEGVAGSPETIITVQYVAGTSDTITVEDASVLPDAPNRVVIQRTDLAFVTVHYGSLTGNVLGILTPESGLTTGTFPMGLSAARRFCESDHEELRDNITALNSGKAELVHADRHAGDGDDPIGVATTTVDGLMSSEDKVILDGHVANITTNPHNVTKAQVGLGNCDNTSDADKPVSTAQATAIGLKAPTSHASTETTYGVSSDTKYGHAMASSTTPIVASTATVGSEDTKFARGDHVHPTDTSRASLDVATITDDGLMSSEDKVILDGHIIDIDNPHSTTATQVGLGNCDNTSDADKPVSTAQATAIGLKVDIAQGVGNANKIVVTNVTTGAIETLVKKTAFNSDIATELPEMDGVAASVGTSTKLAKEDHIHLRDSVLQAQIDFLKEANSPIIGVQWDTTSTSPTLTRIDAAGTPLGAMSTADFDKHILFGGRWRCVRNRTTGEITFGTNARGDGLTLDGAAGDVLVREPIVYAKADYGVAGAGIARYWVSSRPETGFTVHPYWMQRNNGIASPVVYSGAYESYGYLDGATFKLGSASGKVPITGGVAYPDLPNNGRFNISDAETYANNITGTIRSGCENIWNYSATQLLMYIEFGTTDLQTALGRGVVDLDLGTGFAGKNTGADDIDSRLAENGTGTGSGTDGQTPVCWRGKENSYGNCLMFNIGANFYLDGSVRLLKRDGTGTPSTTLAEGSYETVAGPVGLTNGYISATLQDEVSNLAFVPASVAGGGSAYYLCDYWTAPTLNGNILIAGGAWYDGQDAGPSYRSAFRTPLNNYRYLSARLEFYPDGGDE